MVGIILQVVALVILSWGFGYEAGALRNGRDSQTMKKLLSGFNEALTAELAPIYKTKAKEDDKQIMPDGDLPDFVKERCNWALQFGEDGMTFTGMLDVIFAESDEDVARERFYLGAGDDWLPVSDEFREWCDSVWYTFRQERVALYLIYGSNDEKPEKS